MRIAKWELINGKCRSSERGREREGAEVCLCAWKCNHRLLSTCALMRPLRQRQRQRQRQLVEAERQPWSKQQPHQPPRNPLRAHHSACLLLLRAIGKLGKYCESGALFTRPKDFHTFIIFNYWFICMCNMAIANPPERAASVCVCVCFLAH